MTRRLDMKTAELVDIALLTRAAFQQKAAERYAQIAGISQRLVDDIFARPFDKLRTIGMVGYAGKPDDRRQRRRP